jgi:hypothetical protein
VIAENREGRSDSANGQTVNGMLAMKPDSDDIKKQLGFLQTDHIKVAGKPFTRFYCPLTGQDDANAELCLGHVINGAMPNSSRKTIVQRKDIDGFYGRLLEPAFIAIMRMQSQSKARNFYDPEIRKKVGLTILIDGEPCEWYEDQGGPAPDYFTKKTLRSTEFGDLKIVLKKKIDTRVKLTFRLAHDARIESIASLLKAAYLTLFRILGYGFALSDGGREIGYNVIGRFFREHEHDKDARKAAGPFFRQYVNLIRPVSNYTGALPAGTLDTGRGHFCYDAHGVLFGSIIDVRMDKLLAAVLVPTFHDEASKVVFNDFLENKDQRLFLREFNYAERTRQIRAKKEIVERVWPKDEDYSDMA